METKTDMQKLGGLVLIVIGFAAIGISGLLGVAIVIAGLFITWSSEKK